MEVKWLSLHEYVDIVDLGFKAKSINMEWSPNLMNECNSLNMRIVYHSFDNQKVMTILCFGIHELEFGSQILNVTRVKLCSVESLSEMQYDDIDYKVAVYEDPEFPLIRFSCSEFHAIYEDYDS